MSERKFPNGRIKCITVKESPYEYIKEKITQIDKRYLIIFIVSVVFGILIHGYALFNKINFHDDIASLFGIGITVGCGRWGLEIFFLFNAIFLNLNCSMPVINGILSIIFIALSACLIVSIMDISNRLYAILIGLVMISYPVVAATFSFMFTAPYYFLALLLAVMSVYYIEKNRTIIAAIILGFSISLYQAYLMVFTTLMLIMLIKKLLENCNVRSFFGKVLRYLASTILGLGVWLAGFWIWKMIYHISASSGGRIEATTRLKFSQLVEGIFLVYKNFFSILYRDYKGLSNGRGAHLLYFAIFALILLWFLYVLRKRELNSINKILYLVLVVLFPLSIGWLNVLSVIETMDVHTLTMYSYVFLLLIPIFLAESMERELKKGNYLGKGQSMGCIYQWIVLLVAVFGLVYYVRLDNMAYLKTDFIQRQTDSYFTTLVTQIKSVDGYKDDMPVAFIKTTGDSYDLNDKSMFDCNWYDRVTLYSADWNMNKWVTDYAWEKYMNYHCGFAPEIVQDTSELKELEAVKSMPCYPDDGSIKLVDNVIVVNMDSSNEN